MGKAEEKPNSDRGRRDRREEILQEAARQFGQSGFRGATLSSIAKAVGLTEPGLLHYFPSKAILLQSVLEYRDQQAEQKYRLLFDDQEEAFFDSLNDLVESNQKTPGLVRLFTVLVAESLKTDHPSHDFFVARYANARVQFVEYLAPLVERGVLKADCDLEQLASIIMAVMDGLQIQWLLDPENIRMAGTFNLFSEIIAAYMER
jgi:AcrR family transcriptional regulator